jgi:hypothetical protein
MNSREGAIETAQRQPLSDRLPMWGVATTLPTLTKMPSRMVHRPPSAPHLP